MFATNCLVLLLICWFVVLDSTYDLIDPTPVCYTLGLCTEYGEWGTYTSIHPNSEEKTQRTMINLARMYPDDYHSSKYGQYLYGTYGPDWSYDSSGYCGDASDIPYYWLSSVNQASRFGSWDCDHCNGSCGHNTCSEGPDRCTSMFGGDCGFGTRCDAFLVNDSATYGIYCSAEGLCGANMCYADGHCSAMFNPDSRIFGIGFAPNTNGITISYTSGYDSDIYSLVNYSIANVCHFDERIKINSADYNSDGNYLTFMLQWFNKNIDVNRVFVVYSGSMIEMDLAYGNVNNGFFSVNLAIPDNCEAYYFIVETTNDDYYRMPENYRYMFGTAWSNWSWWKPGTGGSRPFRCEENHYYLLDDETTWVANGGPNVAITSDSGCVGCSGTYSIAGYWFNVTATKTMGTNGGTSTTSTTSHNSGTGCVDCSGNDNVTSTEMVNDDTNGNGTDINGNDGTDGNGNENSSDDNDRGGSSDSADSSLSMITWIIIICVSICILLIGIFGYLRWRKRDSQSVKPKLSGNERGANNENGWNSVKSITATGTSASGATPATTGTAGSGTSSQSRFGFASPSNTNTNSNGSKSNLGTNGYSKSRFKHVPDHSGDNVFGETPSSSTKPPPPRPPPVPNANRFNNNNKGTARPARPMPPKAPSKSKNSKVGAMAARFEAK